MKYTLSTILAGVLWGTISVFLKTLDTAGFGTLSIMLCRALISAVILFLFIFFKDKSLFKIELKDLWMFMGTGIISLTFFSVCYFRSILEIGASVAVILLYTSPIFVLIFSFFLFGEDFSLPKVIAVVFAMAGCVMVTGLGSGNSYISGRGILIGLCAGLGYALYSIFSRYALEKYDSLTVTFYTFVFSAVSLLPFGDLPSVVQTLNLKSVFFFLGISFFCTVLPYILYTFGLRGLETGHAAIIVTIEPLVGCLIGIFLWKEKLSLVKVLGILLIFAAVVLCGRKKTV